MTRAQCEQLEIGTEIFIIGAHRCAKYRALYLGLKDNGRAIVEYAKEDYRMKRVVPLSRLMRKGDV